MYLQLDDLQHISSITHEGKVIVFAVKANGAIFYTVRQDGFEDNYGKTALLGWEDWNPLNLPDLVDDPSVHEKERQELGWGSDPREQTLIYRSLYQGRAASAAAPVQLVSALGYLYVFRQSPWTNLLVDRFVLDGMTNRLNPKLDVRFKGSRQKYKPLEASQAGGMQADSLDFRDSNGNYFYEPTLVFDQVDSLVNGWFAVVLLPTAEHDHYRWHFFIYKDSERQLEIISVRASEDGLFDVRDDVQLFPGAGPKGTDAWVQVPGILRRHISLDGPLLTGGPAATKYDLQVERVTQAGPQLLRESTRVMLALPTDHGIATLNFAAGLDGSLSMVEETPDETNLLVNHGKDVLLPINTLDQIQALGNSQPLPQGTISRMARADSDRVTIFSNNPVTLKPGDPVEIGGTASYNGHYRVTGTHNGSFEIQAPFAGSEMGHWQAAQGDTGLVFDGMITAYALTADGKLRIDCPNHGLQPGDEVQIVDTRDYNGTYPVRSIQGQSFMLDIPWQPGRGVNLKLESRKRRGIALDGLNDFIDIPSLDLARVSKLAPQGETISAWVYLNSPASRQEQLIAGRKDGLMALHINPAGKAALRVQFADGPVTIEDTQPAPVQQWTHYAASFAYDPLKLDTTLRLYRNGSLVREGLSRDLAEKSDELTLLLDGEDDFVDLQNPQALNISGRITLEAWIMPRTLDGLQVILTHGNAIPAKDAGMPADPGVFLRIKDRAYEVGTGNGIEQVAHLPVDDADLGQWIHLAGVYDGKAWQLYKNDQESKPVEESDGAFKLNTPWSIGASCGGQGGYFSGLIDEVRIWRTARNPEDLQQAAAGRLLGNEPGLAAYWAFNALRSQLAEDGTLSSQPVLVQDSSRQTNPGTVFGGPRLEKGATLASAHLPQGQAAWQPAFWVGGAPAVDTDTVERGLSGKLADFQVWDMERVPRDVENSMYLQLLGRETGLAGDWRLEAIAEGPIRSTPDFSTFARDALVHGNAYVGARTLNRRLGDNTTPAVRYLNEEFFAVSQRATYTETFEFKVTPALDPNQADADGNPLFAFAYWGKTSQGAQELIPFTGQTNHFEPVPTSGPNAESGWYVATATFTVPDGVSLVRTFGIGEVKGSWDQLDIRRHHIRMISGSITEVRYSEHLNLDTLGTPASVLQTTLKTMAQKELEEPVLIAEKQQLDRQIASADDPALAQKIEQAQREYWKKKPIRDTWYDLLQQQIRNPLNYVTHLRTMFTGPRRILVLVQGNRMQLVDDETAERLGPQTWWFDPHPAGYGYYRIRQSGLPNQCLDVNPVTLKVFLAPDNNSDRQVWVVTPITGPYSRITSRAWGNAKALDVDPSSLVAGLADLGNYTGQYWDIGPWGAPINNAIANATSTFQQLDLELSGAQAHLTTLLRIQQDGQTLKAQWIQRRNEVITALNDLQNQIAALRQTYLDSFAVPTALSLPELQTDSHNLTTTGGLLGFVDCASQLNLAETSEGNLLLSYFDSAGRMRQTVYDATADSSRNDTYQVWIPDAPGIGLNFEAPDGRMQLSHPVSLGEEWTVEAWFAYPLANAGTLDPNNAWQLLNANTLASGTNDRHITVLNGMLGSMQGDTFWSSGYPMSQLAHGWHHIAAIGSGVGAASTTRFYIDGKLAGDLKALQVKTYQTQEASLTELLTPLQNQLSELLKPNANADKNRITELQKQVDDLNTQLKNTRAAREQVQSQPFKVKSDIRTIGNANYLDPIVPTPTPGGPPVPPPDLGQTGGSLSSREQATSAPSMIFANSAFAAPTGPSEPWGKVTEVRIHQVALSPEEVEINSKVSLSGNEPGLAAYFRLNEAKGVDARNSARPLDDMPGMGQTGAATSGGAPTGAYDALLLGRVSWWPCAAPIGNPGHTVMGLDGLDDYIVAPVTGMPSARAPHTIEAWFRTDFIRQDPKVYQGILAWDVPPDGSDGGDWLRLNAQGIESNGLVAHADGLAGGWHHVAVTFGNEIRTIFVDGQLVASAAISGQDSPPQNEVRIGWTRNRPGGRLIEDPFNGVITEVRIWNEQLMPRQILENMHRRMQPGETGLVAYFPLQNDTEPLQINGASTRADNTLPLVSSKVVSVEYSTLGVDATGRQTAMMRRFLACPVTNGIELFTGKRIETLERVWIGNTQFKPTLLGYIEGPPPVPSENLTEKENYGGATQVELMISNDMAYSWTREQDAGLGMALSMYLGVSEESFIVTAPLGVGTMETGVNIHAGAKADLSMGYSFLNNSTISTTSQASSSDRIALTGTPEPQVKFENLGRRFIPKNVGYALVVSGLADIFILRLKRSGKMVAYQVLPNPDIPMDVNTITFMINPTYTMNGSLDGLTGSRATSDRFHRHVPEMRARYGSNYPASYYRLKEAYALKQQIDQQDKQRESYFENFNSLKLDEASVNRSISAPTEMPSASESDARKAEIDQKIQGQELATHAKQSFATWQRKMEDLQAIAGKHNIVNTYVWDSDGGLRAESQSFASTVEHTVGGSFSMDGAYGLDTNFDLFGADFELTAQATVHCTQTLTKTALYSRGLSLNIDLSGMEGTGITDYNDRPILPGEKVSRYRLMSFYLEGKTDHYNAFFNEVVDPEWLQSNSEEARALRQVQTGKANKTWRVLHRVTYVERPALMGFGQDARKLIEPANSPAEVIGAASLDALQAGVNQLLSSSQTLQGDFNTLINSLNALGGTEMQTQQKLDVIQSTLNSAETELFQQMATAEIAVTGVSTNLKQQLNTLQNTLANIQQTLANLQKGPAQQGGPKK